jgi:hypothetical protein
MRGLVPDTCLVSLRLAGWSAVTLLATSGCFVVLFLMLGNFEADGFFAQLDNLARRFVQADPARRAQFLSLVARVALVLLAVVSACRWRSLVAVFRLTPGAPSHA